jgi:cyclase
MTHLKFILIGVFYMCFCVNGSALARDAVVSDRAETKEVNDEFKDLSFKVTQLTPKLYMLEGAGGNITASIGGDGVLLVDCDFAEMSDKLLAKLRELKGSRPRFIINTHFHYVHTGANEVFGQTATIIAASAVRVSLTKEQNLWKKVHPAFSHLGLPILTFDDSLELHVNGDEIKVIHFPNAHSDGDTAVIFSEAKTISTGDLFFSGMYPIFHPEHGGSLNGYVDAVARLLALAPAGARVVPGHGPLSDRREFQHYYEMIVASIAVVRSEVDKGWSLEQIKKQGLPEKWESFSHGYRTTDQWLESIYRSVKNQ